MKTVLDYLRQFKTILDELRQTKLNYKYWSTKLKKGLCVSRALVKRIAALATIGAQHHHSFFLPESALATFSRSFSADSGKKKE